MSVMNKNEIELRIEALKATGVSNGAERTNGLWIILHENARAKKSYSDAIPLRELLGNGDGAVSEESMKQHFGNYWRGKFTRQNDIGNGFINRTMKGCVFVSIDDGIARNDFPNSGNIIKRGDTEVGAVHHFIKTVVTSSKEDGASADAGAEAVIAKLKSMSRSQSTLNRIKTTNGKLQTVMKPEVMSATETYTERSTGKKRGPYNTTPSTHSTEAAESFEAYDIETHGGVEYIKVFAGEGVILKDHEDIWRMLSTSYTPPKWGEHFQSSQTIPQEKKRRISSGADLNLN